jgi:hypothetical protein
MKGGIKIEHKQRPNRIDLKVALRLYYETDE